MMIEQIVALVRGMRPHARVKEIRLSEKEAAKFADEIAQMPGQKYFDLLDKLHDRTHRVEVFGARVVVKAS